MEDRDATVEEPADGELIARARRGDDEAFAVLVSRHEAAVYGFARARLVQLPDADDVTQEAFVRAYEALDRFREGAAVRPWLLGIARNVLREHLRRSKRRKEIAWTSLCLEIEEPSEAEDDRYDEAMRHLPSCVSHLGPSARQALELHYGASMRLAQIGERLRRSEGAIKLLLFRARQALRTCLTGRIVDDD